MEDAKMILSFLGKVFIVLGTIASLTYTLVAIGDMLKPKKVTERPDEYKFWISYIPPMLLGIFGALLLLIT